MEVRKEIREEKSEENKKGKKRNRKRKKIKKFQSLPNPKDSGLSNIIKHRQNQIIPFQ